jgi:hypothetical protein
MKKKQNTKAKKARALTSRKRPLHRRLVLHPISMFLLLCVGVLVIGASLRGAAATYNVTATVPAPVITQPAVIVQPIDGQHTSSPTLAVSGSCPGNSYVKVYRGGTFAGVSVCAAGSFSIQVTLLPGANELKARVFNLTDQPGPASGAITVYYTVPSETRPPASPPTGLQVSQVDEGNYRRGDIPEVTAIPVIVGFAPPFSFVTVTFYSDPLTCHTQADASGYWSCVAPEALPPGTHHVVIVAVTPSGKRLTLPSFAITVGKQAVSQLSIKTDYSYLALREGQTYTRELSIVGGQAPYTVLVDWGDGDDSQLVRRDGQSFKVEHDYKKPKATDQEYTILIQVSDANGTTTVLQLAAVMRGSAELISSQSTVGWLMDGIHRWLWVVWPAYIIVVLMAISFWIGEREVYSRLSARRPGRGRPHAGRR